MYKIYSYNCPYKVLTLVLLLIVIGCSLVMRGAIEIVFALFLITLFVWITLYTFKLKIIITDQRLIKDKDLLRNIIERSPYASVDDSVRELLIKHRDTRHEEPGNFLQRVSTCWSFFGIFIIAGTLFELFNNREMNFAAVKATLPAILSIVIDPYSCTFR